MSYSVKIFSFGAQPIGVIREVRKTTGIGLKEAHDFYKANEAFVVRDGLSWEDAHRLCKTFIKLGAQAAVVDDDGFVPPRVEDELIQLRAENARLKQMIFDFAWAAQTAGFVNFQPQG